MSLDPFLALQSLSAARCLPSPNGHEILLGDLLRFCALLISDVVAVKSAIPPHKKVINGAADEDVWSAVTSLVSLRTTPPTIFNKGPLNTPIKSIPPHNKAASKLTTRSIYASSRDQWLRL
jgi:hypothetical protein